jgi:hypothetical protein
MKTPEENNAALIELLEQVIADVREHGAITAKWTINTEDCGATPYRYRIDAVIDRDVAVTVDFPFGWLGGRHGEVHGPSYGGGYDDEETE